MPIYQGGALQAQVKIATAQQEQSIADFGGVALKAFGEVEVALTNEQLLAKRLPYVEDALRDHSEAVRVANLRYKAGSMDFCRCCSCRRGRSRARPTSSNCVTLNSPIASTCISLWAAVSTVHPP